MARRLGRSPAVRILRCEQSIPLLVRRSTEDEPAALGHLRGPSVPSQAPDSARYLLVQPQGLRVTSQDSEALAHLIRSFAGVALSIDVDPDESVSRVTVTVTKYNGDKLRGTGGTIQQAIGKLK